MSGITSRRKGHAFERFIVDFFKELGFINAHTSRSGDRSKDNQCIDILSCDPFYPQCKYTQTINIHNELDKMPKGKNYNVVFHKRKNRGTVVSLSLEDFGEIIGMLKHGGII